MQESREKIFAPIKGRVYKYLLTKGIRPSAFFAETGLKDHLFKEQGAKSELGGTILTTIVRCYPSLSAHWLLTGEGAMEKMPASDSIQIQGHKILGDHNVVTQSTTGISPENSLTSPNELLHKEELIAELRRHISDLKEELRSKDGIISQLLSSHFSR